MSDQNYTPRQQIGRQAGIMGIAVNAILFLAKCAMGLAGNSVSVLADALNNLTDCASSLVTLVGFRLCGKQADAKHPNGYGRMEYVSGFLVSLFIIFTALSFGKTSLMRIAAPQTQHVPESLLWIPLAAIAMKLALAFYTDSVNKKIGSAALKAMIRDCLSDSVLTGMTMLSMLLSPFTSLPVDGIFGLLISGMILWTGCDSFFEHMDLLLGKGNDPRLCGQIRQIVLARSDVFRRVLSISLFDYGPEKQLAFIQVELNACPCSHAVQDETDNLICELKESLNLEATIYWDAAANAATTAHGSSPYGSSYPDNILCPPVEKGPDRVPDRSCQVRQARVH